MRLFTLFFYSFFLFSISTLAQNVTIACEWSAGGQGDNDRFWGVDHVIDGKFVMVGTTNSSGTENGNIPGFYGGTDAVLAFIDDCNYSVARYGGGEDEEIRDVITTSDNRIIATGWSESNEGHATGNNGGEDGWIIEFDSFTGEYIGSNQIGGSDNERLYAIKELSAGFAAVGKKPSQINGGDDLWIIRVNESFNTNWQTRIGSLGEDVLYDLAVAPDGDIIVVGFVSGNNGELSNYPLTGYGGLDLCVARINGITGAVEWIKSYGGTGEDQGFSIVPSHNEDGYIIVGTSNSSSGQNSGAFDINNPPRGQRDLWVLKIDQNGEKQWIKRYGGNEDEAGRGIIAIDDDKYVISSYSASNAVPLDFSYPSENRGDRDYWILTIDKNGSAVAGATFGGPGNDEAQALALSPQSDFVVSVGFSEGGGGQVSTHYGGQYDAWVVVVQEQLVDTNEPSVSSEQLNLYPNPVSMGFLYLDLPPLVEAESYRLRAYDPLGRLINLNITSQSPGNATIDISNLSPGIYHLNLYNQQEKVSLSGTFLIL